MTYISSSITFTQTSMTSWRASCVHTNQTVARITELEDEALYRVVYFRTPWHRADNPSKTTRTLRGDLTFVQNRILNRGWAHEAGPFEEQG